MYVYGQKGILLPMDKIVLFPRYPDTTFSPIPRFCTPALFWFWLTYPIKQLMQKQSVFRVPTKHIAQPLAL